MRVLLLTPVLRGSGETITALHLGQRLTAKGHDVAFLASPFAAQFLQPAFPEAVQPLTDHGPFNRRLWDETLTSFAPDAVVFADFPLLLNPAAASPLAAEPGWLRRLEGIDACLVTLDHFGFAQKAMQLYLGPPHLTMERHIFPAIPRRMHILLPCPMHEPGWVQGRRGTPFRYWDVPLRIPPKVRAQTRSRFLADPERELLVCHSVPAWASEAASVLGLPLYDHLPRLLDEYLGGLPQRVTVASVNGGSLLQPPPGSRVPFVNLKSMSTSAFEALLFSADLVLTENKVSIAMGKAICGLVPAAALHNTFRLRDLMVRATGAVREVLVAMERRRLGSVYPFEVFPLMVAEDFDRIVLYRRNLITDAFADVELFGGEATARRLAALLTDEGTRGDLRVHQQRYVDALSRLDDGVGALATLVDWERDAR